MIIEQDILEICPHTIHIKSILYDGKVHQMARWCGEHFGNCVVDTDLDKVVQDGVWEFWRFVPDGYTFYFKNKTDAMFFKLKWS